MKMGTGPVLKGLMVAFVALVLLAPVQMLRGLVEERARLRQDAVTSVARGWGGEQLIGGPILASLFAAISRPEHLIAVASTMFGISFLTGLGLRRLSNVPASGARVSLSEDLGAALKNLRELPGLHLKTNQFRRRRRRPFDAAVDDFDRALEQV